jgi:hypothetical protein
VLSYARALTLLAFFSNQGVDVMAVFDESLVLFGRQLIPWPRQIDPDLFANFRRPSAQHKHTVCQINRFFDVVRDEKDGL